MRILSLFFRAIITISILGFLIGLGLREILLATAVGQVRSATKELKSLGVGSEFTKTCLEYAGLPADGQSLTRLQLRFTSDKDFVVEMVCDQGSLIRETIKTSSLPPLVTKVAGQSGIISGQSGQAVALTIFGRTGVIYEEDSFIKSSLQEKTVVAVGNGPATTCEGYGYQCCSQNYQQGQGDQVTQAWDCPLSCYSQCAEKPVVLSFNSDPAVEGDAKVVTVSSGDQLEFFYTLNDINGDAFSRAAYAADEAAQLTWEERLFRIVDQWSNSDQYQDVLEKIVINFGDGDSLELIDLQGTTSHTYTCTRSLCVFNATIQAVTTNGLTSDLDNVSKIQVQVRP